MAPSIGPLDQVRISSLCQFRFFAPLDCTIVGNFAREAPESVSSGDGDGLLRFLDERRGKFGAPGVGAGVLAEILAVWARALNLGIQSPCMSKPCNQTSL